MTIAIGNDHAGTAYKYSIKSFLENKGYTVVNYGTDSNDSVDYPDFVHPVVQDVIQGKATYGILLCGSANGVAITANKYKSIRAGLCWEKDIVSLVRQHNNANVLCLPARFISEDEALQMVEIFLNTLFEGGRHQNRINKITSCL